MRLGERDEKGTGGRENEGNGMKANWSVGGLL